MILNTIEDLQKYFNGVKERANNHAGNVNNIIYPLLSFVILYSSYINAREYKGELANIVKVDIKNKSLCIMYEHETESIIVKEKNHKGIPLKSFNNESTIEDIKDFFNKI